MGTGELAFISCAKSVQESPLEIELDDMMGKPVHTLSVDDDSETSDSTVLGPKLTDNQINRLGDIFEDRRASSFLFLSHCTVADQAVHIHDSCSLPSCQVLPRSASLPNLRACIHEWQQKMHLTALSGGSKASTLPISRIG